MLTMQHQSTPTAQRHARTLRREMTDSERLLWSRLRGEQLGVKFRRQHPLGPYVADFVCLAPRLVVELDGSHHADRSAYDAARDRYMQSLGFEVLRFPSDAPFNQLDGVLTVIHQRIHGVGAAPTPTLPQRGRETVDRSTP